MPVAPVGKLELLSRLAAGPVSVVTPNRRLAQELAREFDAAQSARGLPFWDSADVLTLDQFVARLYEDALTSDLAPRLPRLLGAAQEQALWEAAIRASAWGEALLAVPRAALECVAAWTTAHAWRIDGALGAFPGNDDARAFAEWSADYAKRCARDGHTEAARLADVMAPLLNESALRRPALLVAYAFDALTPQQEDFLGACAGAGIEVRSAAPEPKGANARRHVFPSAREELAAAAQWAREKLEGGARRIGVVVPELGLRRKEVARVFSRVMRPGHNLPDAERRALPFNISLGAPLAEYPLVHAALAILELAAHEIPFDQASRLIRSPFIAGASDEMAPRALLDAALRRNAPAKLGLGKLVARVTGTPILRQKLEALFAMQKPDSASPHDWGRRFSALLAAVDFPGRRLDSGEYQAQAKFIDTLAEFTRLALVVPRLGMREAVARLARLCADTLFQPESPDAPVQVLGFIESLGLEFDALWVTGLTDEAWPARARPNPFIPPALQRKAGIAEASAEKTLERAKRITDGWLHAADEVIVSHPAHEADRALIGSPLISGVPGIMGTPETRSPTRYRDLIFAARQIERVPDGQAPALATKTPKGGTRILSDQAACPFRAFARHRLNAEALEEPQEGLDARARGLLLHELMKELWTELKGSQGLKCDVGPAIGRAAQKAVEAAKLEGPFAALEEKRLAQLAREWLEVERQREPFEVAALEEKRNLVAGGLDLSGRIDRMDRLAGGGYALLDYKGGRTSRSDWLGARPDEPQLPAYAVNAKEDVAAVAFAKLKPGELRFSGYSREKGLLPRVDLYRDWAALVAGWTQELEALGAGFAAGDARVDPKKRLSTCRYCDLQPLCRVYERLDALGDEGEDE